MYQYEKFGLVNTREMFKNAYANKYAVPAFNFVALEQLMAIAAACGECNSPFIIQCSANVRKYLGATMVQRMVQAAVETLRDEGKNMPIALNLDHGMTFEECASCIDSGFSNVMIDGSALPFEENIALTARVAEYARARGVTVEGELGVLAGVEEEGAHNNAASLYTDPGQVEEFVTRSGVDSLAISIGTCHGVVKVRALPDGTIPELRYDILEDIGRRLPLFPIVLHGASAILPEYVKMINENGGNLLEAQGIPEEQVRKAAQMAVCKVNTASDGWIAYTAIVRRALAQNPEALDPRAFLKLTIPEMKKVYVHKIRDVFGSANMA